MAQQINPATKHAIHNLIVSAEELAERSYTDKRLKAKRGYMANANREDFELTVKQDIEKLREVLGDVAIVTAPHPAPSSACNCGVGHMTLIGHAIKCPFVHKGHNTLLIEAIEAEAAEQVAAVKRDEDESSIQAQIADLDRRLTLVEVNQR